MKSDKSCKSHKPLRHNSAKKGSFSMLGSLIIAVILFAVIMIALFGEGLIPKSYEKVKNALFGVPEIDPRENEFDFFRNNDNQLEFLTQFDKVIQDSISATMIKDMCLAQLPNFDEGFYAEDSNYNLYLEQDGVNINIRLTQYRKQGYEQNVQKTETPVQTTVIKDARLCIINGQSAEEFYTNFNNLGINGKVGDTSGIDPNEVAAIKVSSGIDEKNKDERKMEVMLMAGGQYEQHDFFKGGEKTTIYMLRIQEGNNNYVCFFPAHADFGTPCGEPDNGYSDSDCFDSDDSENTVRDNIAKGLIQSYYVCGDDTVTDADCMCGGTKNGNSCENIFSEDQCNCANSIAFKYAKLNLNTILTGDDNFNYDSNAKKCRYPAQAVDSACDYVLTAESSFMKDIGDYAWICPE